MSHHLPRRNLLGYVPEQLVEYPLETLLAIWGLLAGASAATAVSAPASLTSLLPPWTVLGWSIAMGLGGAGILIGLWRHLYASLVPRSMQLVGSACVCYAISIEAVIGIRGSAAAGLLLTIGAQLYLRAWWLRTRDRLFHEIDEGSA